MGKTKTAFVTGEEQALSGEEKYKLKLKKRAEKEAKEKAKVEGLGLKGGERIKVVGADVVPQIEEEKEEEKGKKQKQERQRGKKYLEARAKIDKTKNYEVEEAIKLVKETSYSSFDGTMEAHILVKKQGLNVTVNLPHSTGKTKKIEIASEETISKLQKGVIDFDVLLATPDMMPKLLPFARLLGPKGLLPNPKTEL